ncbi:hypothetical protein EPI10_024612 [Gossypium australe]|uniref:Uncharacterized protein n=1 Tax=Gossypium australe TaxID=47621 RepID=A0A5B6VZ92_9ROSI|nr:hypothetical protein EPI10_024612 [Gossypium australe]
MWENTACADHGLALSSHPQLMRQTTTIISNLQPQFQVTSNLHKCCGRMPDVRGCCLKSNDRANI